jgi:hypothetical protein
MNGESMKYAAHKKRSVCQSPASLSQQLKGNKETIHRSYFLDSKDRKIERMEERMKQTGKTKYFMGA